MSKHKYYFTLTAAFLTLFVSAQNSENIVLELNTSDSIQYKLKVIDFIQDDNSTKWLIEENGTATFSKNENNLFQLKIVLDSTSTKQNNDPVILKTERKKVLVQRCDEKGNFLQENLNNLLQYTLVSKLIFTLPEEKLKLKEKYRMDSELFSWNFYRSFLDDERVDTLNYVNNFGVSKVETDENNNRIAELFYEFQITLTSPNENINPLLSGEMARFYDRHKFIYRFNYQGFGKFSLTENKWINFQGIISTDNHQHEKHYPEKMDRRIVTTFSLEE